MRREKKVEGGLEKKPKIKNKNFEKNLKIKIPLNLKIIVEKESAHTIGRTRKHGRTDERTYMDTIDI